MKLDKKDLIVVVLSMFIFFLIGIFYASTIGRNWFDEAFSIIYSQHSIGYIITPHDVHPPIFYLTIHTFMSLFGFNEMNLRFLSLFFSSLTIIILFFIIKELYPEENTELWWIFFIIYTLATTTMHYATEIRMYAQATFLTTLGIYFAIKYMKYGERKNQIIWFIFSGLAIWTHYYTILPVILTFIFILSKSNSSKIKLKNFADNAWILIILTITASLYALQQMKRVSNFSFQYADFRSLPSTIYYFFNHNSSQLVHGNNFHGIAPWIFLTLAFFCVIIAYKMNLKKTEKKFLIIISIMPPIIGMFINTFIIRAYHHRFFIFTSWAFILLLSIGLIEIEKRQKTIARIIFTTIIVLMLLNIQPYFENQNAEIREAYLQIPCDNTTIIHVTTFSSEPIQVLDQEYGCNRQEITLTNLTKEQQNGIGFDALDQNQIITNQNQLKQKSFYSFEPSNQQIIKGNCTKIFEKEGITIKKCST